jgi:MSHA biogenesis protein MshM
MYLEHFRMRELPFSLTPNTEFVYDHGGHREALNVLLVALRSGEGFVKVVGEVGTGKTLLCRALLRALGDECTTAYMPHPPATARGVQIALAFELRVPDALRVDPAQLPHAIGERLMELHAAGRPVLLVVDEAQTLPFGALEALRLLSNIETESAKLLQIALFAQPELELRLARPELRQLRQRIAFSYRLHRLDRARLAGYVRSRLRAAGCLQTTLFSPRALDRLHRASAGVPRLVNVLAHKALLDAFGRGDARVEAGHVRRAIRDTDSTRMPLRQRLARGLGWETWT